MRQREMWERLELMLHSDNTPCMKYTLYRGKDEKETKKKGKTKKR